MVTYVHVRIVFRAYNPDPQRVADSTDMNAPEVHQCRGNMHSWQRGRRAYCR